MKFYRVVDGKHDRNVTARKSAEFRPPRQGEYYLSGARPVAYMAPNDLETSFRIMELVEVEKDRFTGQIKRVVRVIK